MSKLTLSFKGTVLRVYPVLAGSMTIGNDPECTIHIDSLALQPRHARIDTQDDTSVLVDLDSESGTFVNNARITKHMLKDGDVIRVGKHTLSFKYEPPLPDEETLTMEIDLAGEIPHASDAPPAAEPAPAEAAPAEVPEGKRRAWLQILTGQNLGKTLSLNRSMTNLGKPGVATAVVTRRKDGYFLSHLEGEKCPLVGDRPIGEHSVKLNDGDIITIGNVQMQFFLD